MKVQLGLHQLVKHRFTVLRQSRHSRKSLHLTPAPSTFPNQS